MFHVTRSLDCSFATMVIIGAIFHVNVYRACGCRLAVHLPLFSEFLNTDSDLDVCVTEHHFRKT